MAPRDGLDRHARPRAREVDDVAALFRPPPRGSCLLVDGDPGIGKSWLLDEAAAVAAASGWAVTRARAERDLQDVPLAALPDGLRPGAVTRGDRAALTLVLDRLEALTVREPVLLAVDDAQWLDPLSCRLLSALGSRTGAWPLVLAVAHRRWPLPPTVMDALADLTRCGPRRLQLGPLTPAETRALAESAAGGPLPAHVAALLPKTGGNPFYVIESVRAGQCTPPSPPGTDAPDPLDELRRAALRRVAECGTGVEDVLRPAAVLGADFHVPDLELLCGVPAAVLAGPLHAATRAGVLTDDRARATLRFTHDLVREAVLADTPEAVRRALHRDAALALGRAGRPPARVADQWTEAVAAGSGDVDDATRWLRRAAAGCPSPVTALAMLDRALGLLAERDPRRRDIQRERLPALAACGRHRAVLDESAALLIAGEDPEVRGWHGLALMGTGQVADALADLDALAETPSNVHDPRVVPFAALGATLALWFGDEPRAVAACERLERSDLDDGTRSTLLATRALAATARGELPEALALARRGVALADARQLPRAVVIDPYMTLGNVMIHLDDFAEAERCFRLIARFSLKAGTDPPPGYHWGLVGVHYLTGRLDDAVTEASAGLEQARETGESWGTSVGVSIRARCLLHHGRLEDVTELPAPGDHAHGYADDWMTWVRALLHEAHGEDADAARAATRAWQAQPGLRYLYGWRMMAADLVRLTRHLDPGTATDVSHAAAVGADRAGPDAASAHATADWCRGILQSDPGLLETAAATLAREGWRGQAARAGEDHASALLGHGRRAEAVTAYRTALGGWEAIGASHDRRRVAAELRRLGVATRPRAPRAAGRTGWAALTPSERDVCALVTEGLTNREMGERLLISRRTVETHLQHAYRKMDVSNRAHLASLVAEHLRAEDR